MNSEIFKRIISSLIILPLILFCIIKGSIFFNGILLIVLFLSSYEWHMMTKKKKYYIYGYIFLILSISSTYNLRFDFDNSLNLFLFVTTICILTDIGGFVFGKIFKGPKLTKYSPNKTLSGLFGSFILALCSIPLNISIDNISNQNTELVLFTLIISFGSQLGDIIISYFKRKSKIKDTGKIIPGHGGLLDRIDGMLFAFPLSYLLILTNYFNIQ